MPDQKTLADVVCAFLLSQFEAHRAKSPKPFFVGLCGPQGSGKSYLSNAVQDRLGAKSLKVVFVALDDFYYPQDHLRALKITHCNNVMLDGRGLPGTHDVALGARIMQELSEANDRPGQTIELPVYDKSKHAGLGDRSAETRPVAGPIDIIVFEGWCVGFHPLSADALAAAYDSGRVPNEFAVFKSPPPGGVEQPVFKRHSLASLQEVNEFLGAYVDQLWSHLGALIQLVPEDMAYTYDWRLQQEHTMKERNGGKGMTDEQVRAFVTRYMPGYELFSKGVTEGLDGRKPPWSGNTLRIEISKARLPNREERL